MSERNVDGVTFMPSSQNTRRTLFTFRVGAITQWVKDVLIIILLWKLIAMI